MLIFDVKNSSFLVTIYFDIHDILVRFYKDDKILEFTKMYIIYKKLPQISPKGGNCCRIELSIEDRMLLNIFGKERYDSNG